MLGQVAVLTPLPVLLCVAKPRLQDAQSLSLSQTFVGVAAAKRIVSTEYAKVPDRRGEFQICILVLVLVVAIVGAVRMGGLQGGILDSYLLPSDSYLQDYYDDLADGFGSRRLLDAGLLLKRPEVGSPGYRAGLQVLGEELRDHKDVAAVMRWLDDLAQGLATDAGPSAASVAIFAYLASSAGEAHIRDANFSDGVLEAARCSVRLWQPLNQAGSEGADEAQFASLTALTSASNVSSTLYHRAWPEHMDGNSDASNRVMLQRTMLWALAAIFIARLFVPLHASLSPRR